MAPKQDRVYARGRSKSVASYARLVIGSNDEHDPEYVPPGTATLSRAARAIRATPKKVASDAVTASQSDEERTVTCTPSGTATHDEGASGPQKSLHPPHLHILPRLMRLTVLIPLQAQRLVHSP